MQDDYYMSMQEWAESERPLSRSRSARFSRPPRTPRALSPRKAPEDEQRLLRNNERNRRVSARDPPRSAYSRRASVTQRPAFTIYWM